MIVIVIIIVLDSCDNSDQLMVVNPGGSCGYTCAAGYSGDPGTVTCADGAWDTPRTTCGAYIMNMCRFHVQYALSLNVLLSLPSFRPVRLLLVNVD